MTSSATAKLVAPALSSRWLDAARLVAAMEIKGARLRKPAQVAQLLVEPVVYTALFATALASLQPGPSRPAQLAFLAPGVIALQAIRGMARVVYRATIERRWGLATLKLSSGVPPSAYLAGLLSVPLLIFTGQAVVVTVLTSLLGADLPLGTAAAMVVLSLPAAAFWFAAGFVLTGAISSYERRDLVLGLALTPLMFAAPTLYSLHSAPAYLRAIATVNPLTYHVEAARSVTTTAAWPAIALSVGLAVLALAVAQRSVGRLRQLTFEA